MDRLREGNDADDQRRTDVGEQGGVGSGATGLAQIQFSIDDGSVADAIVDRLLAGRLVACGQRLGPIMSRYRWKGELERAEEWLVVLKTRRDLAQDVVSEVVAHHPYQTPEVVVVPVTATTPDYLRWVVGETRTEGGCGPDARGHP